MNDNATPTSSSGQATYTCPMHPEVIRQAPDTCPKCGMALESSSPAQDNDNPELNLMTRRLVFSLFFSGPLFILSMATMFFGVEFFGLSNMSGSQWLQLALATPVCTWGAWPFYERAIASVRAKSLNMFTLIGLGVAVGYGYSVVASCLPGLLPDAFRNSSGQAEVYFEAAAMIVTLVLAGQVLELRARARTGQALNALMDLAPKTAHRIGPDGKDETIPVAQVSEGDRIRVLPGERIPLDAKIVDGVSAIDQSMVTGESIPVEKQPGDGVIGGTLNGNGSLVLLAGHTCCGTMLSRITSLVAEAQRSRAPIQRLADVVASYFVPVVLAVAVVTFVTWGLLGPEPRLAHALVNAIAVLIIACPCALGIATPMSITVAMGKGAQYGILFRNARALETLLQVDTLVLDKTGTLTQGKPELVTIKQNLKTKTGSQRETLHLAASLERSSEHPLSRAFLEAAKEQHMTLDRVEDFCYEPGSGILGAVKGKRLHLGTSKFLEANGIDVSDLDSEAQQLRIDGQTVVYFAINKQLQVLFGVADPLKAESSESLQALHTLGLEIILLSGDHETSARAVANQLGIQEVISEVLPEEKAATIRQLQRQGRKVAMAGDGVNDAPALAQADVGIAMGDGTEVAMQTADVTLLKGDLRGIQRARTLSQQTMRNVKQNLVFAFAYNSLGVPLAAGVLYPVLGLVLSPILAAVAMSLSSLSVITNALRLRRVRL